MFLKSLTLKGFKSFAEATTMELEPGVTVVVGPNGSGKSNVVDAIAWVLGAQAPSAVRSQKMDDVIFAGTATRPALGRAEVSLTIDNSAGILPIEFSEVTVRRTLFRSGDSEYAINDVPCRLLDVQELLSDAGVGRQQHVIISQGQIDAVLNARPEERRSIIEEAAGVLKYRKRKEKAERRLDATEANLLRVQDLLREVRRQLRPLERQAEAARRHGELIGELTGLRIHVAGREIGALRTTLGALATAKIDAASDETALKSQLAWLDTEVMTSSAELSARRTDDLNDRLVRVEQLKERARGLAAVIVERRRALERDRGQLLDAGIIATLENDAARYGAELLVVRAELAGLDPEIAALSADEEEFGAARQGVLALFETAEPAASAASAVAEVRGELRSRRASAERAGAESMRGTYRIEELAARLNALARRADELGAELAAATADREPLVEAIEANHERSAAAATTHERCVAARQAAAEVASGAAARVEALQMALDAARTRAGAERLAGSEGVLGTLLDLIRIDVGWEAAVEAALGEAVTAVVMGDPDAARRALHALRGSDATGAVLALGLAAPIERPPVVGGEAVRPHVSADRAGVGPLLDRLLAGATRVDDIERAAAVAGAHPDAVVVTVTGDRFGRTGWRIGAAGAGVTAATLEDAERDAALAVDVLRRCDADALVAARELEASRREAAELRRLLADGDDRIARVSTAQGRATAERREADAELEPLRRRIAELNANLTADSSRIAELEALLPELEAGEVAEADEVRSRTEARAALDARAAVLSGRRRDLDVRTAGLAERAQFLQDRVDAAEGRLVADAEARREAARRRIDVERSLAALDRLAALVDAHRGVVEAHHAELVERRREQTEQVGALAAHLDELRAARTAAERSLDEVREKARRTELQEAEARLRLEAAVDMVRRDLDVEPEAAEAAGCPQLPDGVSAQARARELDRELRLLGPINPLALQEFTELQERHTFLEEQLDDVRTTRRELSRVIRAIDGEIQTVFAAAYEDVSTNFTTLFGGLFPGGGGRLVLTQPDDLLNTGIEVEAKPGGKNVKKLSLLSGGERSLTALAFLFAVFRSRPSPFYVMDEVEAALDDVNLHRFLGLIAEFRRDAQLLVVSHQKRTMEAGDSLLGVTMQPGGSSKVIAERVTAPTG
ncbi:MAG: chromosome segregation protein SMC [Ilumatobacteraceae bacterium]